MEHVAAILIGPGGAGKSTAGSLLAARLGVAFIDLDFTFRARFGDIGVFIECNGYDEYAARNIDVCESVFRTHPRAFVFALSSGFMTYPAAVHPRYAELRHRIETHPNTVVLIPSLSCETCVIETVRRQLTRPFARSPAREEAAIRVRFSTYVGLRARKVETGQPAAAVADEIAGVLRGPATPNWESPDAGTGDR